MKILLALASALALASCSGKVTGPAEVGTSACDQPPDGTCVLCTDNRWHCASGGTYDPCATRSTGCTGGKSCVLCNSDGTGLLCGAQILNPGGDNNVEQVTIKVSCTQ